MKTQGHITHRSLRLQGGCAFVRAALNEQHPIKSRRPAMSLCDEGWMHPGQGGA